MDKKNSIYFPKITAQNYSTEYANQYFVHCSDETPNTLRCIDYERRIIISH